MTDKELERRLELALSVAAPDDLEGVLSRCEARKGTVIPMTKKRPSRTIRNLMAACLALALVGGRRRRVLLSGKRCGLCCFSGCESKY